MGKRGPRVSCGILLVVAAATFLNFVWLANEQPIGSALGGSSADGHDVLRNHAESFEVDRATWDWRRIHEITVLLSFPFLVIGLGLAQGSAASVLRLAHAVAGRRSVDRPPSTDAVGRVELVRGPLDHPRATGTVGFEIGGTSLPLEVAVHDTGLLLDAQAAVPRVILAEEIEPVIGTGAVGDPIRIWHSAPELASPFALGGVDAALAAAIDRLAPGQVT